MQEIKLQDCEQRRRWEWEDTQADLFGVQIMYLSRATIMHLITATSQAIKPGSYIGKMVTILWL